MFSAIYKYMLGLRVFKNISHSSRCKFNSCVLNKQENVVTPSVNLPHYVEIKLMNPADTVLLSELLRDMTVLEDFINSEEEATLMGELEPILRRKRYEFDHWDDAIHGFRETERLEWSKQNSIIFDRVRDIAFRDLSSERKSTLEHVHVLDLNKDGRIKPHVDSVRFCGHTIAGLSLLSNSVMRLKKVPDEEITKESDTSETLENNLIVDILLKRKSLYIMSHSARYYFTHEILGKDESYFKNESVPRDRRVSVICRNHPSTNTVPANSS